MKNYKYRIGIDLFSFLPITVTLFVFGAVSIWLYLTDNGMFVFTGLLTALVLVIMLYTLYTYWFIKILVNENGFYYQSRIGNGRYYNYSEIIEAWESNGKAANGTKSRCINLKTENGSVIKFDFTAVQSEGVEYLLERINGQGEEADEE